MIGRRLCVYYNAKPPRSFTVRLTRCSQSTRSIWNESKIACYNDPLFSFSTMKWRPLLNCCSLYRTFYRVGTAVVTGVHNKICSSNMLHMSSKGDSQCLPIVTLFTKEECSLCDDAKVIIEKHRDKFLFQVVDITYPGNQYWYEQYKYDIPVLHLNGKFIMKHRVFEQAFVDSLENAQQLMDRITSQHKESYPKNLSCGKETLLDEFTNFFTKSPLNRLSFSRGDSDFLYNIHKANNTKYIIFSNMKPLLHKHDKSKKYHLTRFSFEELSRVLGVNFHKELDVIFLGGKQTCIDVENEVIDHYFAVNINDTLIAEELKELSQMYHAGAEFSSSFSMFLKLDDSESSLACHARCILEWHGSHKFCAVCGSATKISEAGYKRTCSKDDCSSHKYTMNVSYPRVDPVVMALVLSSKRDAILLGRKASFPKNMYSCLSGFVEPGESIENAVRREVYEESGVPVSRVQYHSSQPWPFPSSLMIGCIAEATELKLTKDPEELEDLQWFTKAEVTNMILPTAFKEGKLFIPPRQSLAHHLIKFGLDCAN